MSHKFDDHRRKPPTIGNMSRNDLLRAIGQGQVTPLDRFGQPIKPGHLALINPGFDPVGEILAVSPVLDPNAPPGVARVSVLIRMDLMTIVNQPNMSIAVVGTVPQRSEDEAASAMKPAAEAGHNGAGDVDRLTIVRPNGDLVEEDTIGAGLPDDVETAAATPPILLTDTPDDDPDDK